MSKRATVIDPAEERRAEAQAALKGLADARRRADKLRERYGWADYRLDEDVLRIDEQRDRLMTQLLSRRDAVTEAELTADAADRQVQKVMLDQLLDRASERDIQAAIAARREKVEALERARAAFQLAERAAATLEAERQGVETQARARVAAVLSADFRRLVGEIAQHLVPASAIGEKLRLLRDAIVDQFHSDLPGVIDASFGEPGALLALACAFDELRPAQRSGETRLSLWLREARGLGCEVPPLESAP